MMMTIIRKHLQAPGIVEMLTSLAFSASAHLCHTFDQVGFQLFWLVFDYFGWLSIILGGFQPFCSVLLRLVRTFNHEQLICNLTINCDGGKHSQFLQFFLSENGSLRQ